MACTNNVCFLQEVSKAFDAAYAVFPVHKPGHWVTIAVDWAARQFITYDSLGMAKKEGCLNFYRFWLQNNAISGNEPSVDMLEYVLEQVAMQASLPNPGFENFTQEPVCMMLPIGLSSYLITFFVCLGLNDVILQRKWRDNMGGVCCGR